MTLSLRTRKSIPLAALVFAAGVNSPAWAAPLDVAQSPLYLPVTAAPLNMLVMGKDHKLYYEAYNDASDLNGDGAIDVGYKPDTIEYYGYFNSRVCYEWDSGDNRFEPRSDATGTNGKQCSGRWSGDFLNYLTTGRLDALRKVLYGGYRNVDSATDTVLQGAFFPQDAHSWGKEYASIARDGFDIANYSPLTAPTAGRYHLFGVTTVTDNSAPLFRIQTNSPFRIWNWLSIEGPVAGTRCFNDNRVNPRVVCTAANIQSFTEGLENFFSYPSITYTTWRRTTTRALSTNLTSLNNNFTADAINSRRCDVSTTTVDNVINRNNNPFRSRNGCPNNDNEFLAQYAGTFVPTVGGTWRVQISHGGSAHLQLRDSVTATDVANFGVYNQGGNGTTEADVTLIAGRTYNLNYRWETRTAGNRDQRIRWRRPLVAGATALTNARVRVQACSSTGYREDNCKEYVTRNASGDVVASVFKPTGLLHDFGETDRMYFGLITGSQANNTQGGVLRRNVESFRSEVNQDTGQFNGGVNGIAQSLDRLRMIGGGYGGGTTDNLNSDSNWAWANGTGNCESQGSRAVNNGECRMWGNPIGEMMLEALRYYAGGGPTSAFSSGGSSQGQTEDATLGLAAPTWKDPYDTVANAGLGYVACAKPVMTVISDINPSYDSNVPGGWDAPTIDLPDTIAGFSLDTVGDDMWNAEFGAGTQNVFIGEAATTDGAPTVKSATSFGDIRGLSPEEPTKEGSYAAAAVSYFGWTLDGGVNERNTDPVRTYAVALASPLPRVEFPVISGGVQTGTITFVPFAKTAGGTFGGDARKPTNTIVDFYVEEFVNLPGQDTDVTVNGGLPKAIFRINYEDVEQGNDHDMDAIVRYDFTGNADGSVTVRLTSEYAAGSAIQHMGYVVSGTTADGVYLEVRDSDTAVANSPAYSLNTPPGRAPGYCVTGPAADCDELPLVATRVFTPGSTDTDAIQLRDPLWYAAKFGGFDDNNDDGIPGGDEEDEDLEWDSDENGTPDKYFLVTNALTLKNQLAEAFSQIEADSRPAAGVAASGTRRDVGFLAYIPAFTSLNWTGEVSAHFLTATGAVGLKVWSALDRLPDPADRDMFVVVPGSGGDLEMKTFTEANLGSTEALAAAALGFGSGELSATYDATVAEAIDYFRGVDDKEQSEGGRFRNRIFKAPATADDPPRDIHSPIGDILNSQPEVLSRGSQGYGGLPEDEGGGDAYGDFVTEVKGERTAVLFVGANDGALHAFNGDFGLEGGKEIFAIIPDSTRDRMARLASPGYTHEYFMDASPTQGDAYFAKGGTGALEWRTVLLAGNGAGGRSMLALDVTDPVTSFGTDDFLWEFSDSDLGLTTSRAQVVLMQDGRWYAVFGNGINSDAERAYLYLVPLEDPDEFVKIPVGTDTGNGLMSFVAIDALAPDGDVEFPTPDLKADVIYATDYLGRVWKLDVSSEDSTEWAVSNGGTPLFAAVDGDGNPQHITGGINVTTHPDRGNMLYFGTGRYLLEGDNSVIEDPQVQTFYAIWDNALDGAPATLDPIEGRGELVEQTITSVTSTGSSLGRNISDNIVDYSSARGWFVDLIVQGEEGDGERFIGEPRVELGRVIFPTFVSQGDQCAPGGINWLYGLSAITGSPELTFVNEDGSVSSTTIGAIRLTPPGESTPPAVAPPIVADPGTDPGLDCIPGVDAGCDPPEPPCVPGVDEDCDLPEDGSAIPGRVCKLNLGVLLAEGLKTFSSVSCGRQSWRQIR